MSILGAVAARVQLMAAGARPVAPLDDGRDLWADDDGDVFAYTRTGRVLVVMTIDEYRTRHAEMVERVRKLHEENR